MSSTTKNLGLFKYDTDIDIDEVFSIEQALNDNWDIIDSAIPTKTSQLVNDSGFLTSHQSLSNYVNLNGAQTISGAKTFTGTTKVPASSTTGTALQLAGQSGSANGYIKFGSGIIIQWGYRAATGTTYHGGVKVSFAVSFPNTNYQLALAMYTKNNSGGVDFQDCGYASKAVDGFNMRIENTEYLSGCSYIAIGY